MDYDEEDKLDSPRFNRELWIGMMAHSRTRKSAQAKIFVKTGQPFFGNSGFSITDELINSLLIDGGLTILAEYVGAGGQ
jgi:hypothetical protein